MTPLPPRLLLDRSGDAFVPAGYQVVETEAAFVQNALPFGADRLLVRGPDLCRWAEAIARSRAWTFAPAHSPREALRACCADNLSDADARRIVGDLAGRYADLPTPFTARDVLDLLLPGERWHRDPSLVHGAQWLLWLDEHEPPAHLHPLLAAVCAAWRQQCGEQRPEHLLYEQTIPGDARALLSAWLGVGRNDNAARRSPPRLAALGTFPADQVAVPHHWRARAREAWSHRLVAENGTLIDTLSRHAPAPPRPLLEDAAHETLRYFVHHSSDLTPQTVRDLRPYLPDADRETLQNLLPPPDPGDVPQSHPDVLAWFTERYLPYRERQAAQTGDESAARRVGELARQFAAWYGRFYPGALSGGPGREHLVLSETNRLRNVPAATGNGALFWVILDGLHYADAERLRDALRRRTPDFAPAGADLRPVFGTLPTITQFCKPALLKGVPPAPAADRTIPDLFPDAVVIKENRDPAEALRSAAPGRVFVWSVLEPDRTYHKPGDRTTLTTNARAALDAVAEKIARALEAAPTGLPLQIVIATDHGRLLSSHGERRHAPPLAGMEAHGRAAWGAAGRNFDASGFVVEGDLAYLSAARFGLPADAAVLLDENAFMTVNEHAGAAPFAHGGLFPEEVILPWLTLARVRPTLSVSGRVTGRARANGPGTLLVEGVNPSDTPLTLVSLTLERGGGGDNAPTPLALFLDGAAAPPRAAFTASVLVDRWPTRVEAAGVQATLTLRQPDGGATFTVALETDLQSDELYARRDDLLEDL